MSGKNGIEWLVKLFNAITKGNGVRKSFDMNLDKVRIISGGNGSLVASMMVEEAHSNQGGFLHGGMTALLVDIMSGLALMTYPGDQLVGVSVNMNIEYLKPCFTGQEIIIKASTDKVGKRIAFLKVEIFNKATGDMIAKGSHIKFM